MFEQLFEEKMVSAVGGKVVDDSRNFTILVSIPAGKADFVSVSYPNRFTPNVPFTIVVNLKNNGGEDWIFARLINRDTGVTVKDERKFLAAGGTATWNWSITLSQGTDFHAGLEIGHET